MKKVLIGLGILVVLIGGGVYYVYSNLDALVEQVIEQKGTEAIGSQVAVDSLTLDLVNGNVSIYGFSIANPEGFSHVEMLRFDELSVDLDVASLNSDVIRINRIVARNPYVLYESIDGNSNLDAVSERFADDGTSEPEPAEASGNDVVLSIGEIVIEGIQGKLSADLLNDDLDVDLGDIRLQDLNGTSEEIATQATKLLVSQLSDRATSALMARAGELLGGEITARAEEELDALQEQAEEKLENIEDDLKDDLNEKLEGELGNFLRR